MENKMRPQDEGDFDAITQKVLDELAKEMVKQQDNKEFNLISFINQVNEKGEEDGE